MSAKTLTGKFTLGFVSDDTVRIEVVDDTSGIHLIEVRMTTQEFAKALGARAFRPCTYELRGAENVGKTRVTEDRVIEVPDMGYQPETYEHWLQQNAQEPGWIVSTYLGSRGSIERKFNNDTVRLHYSVTKFI